MSTTDDQAIHRGELLMEELTSLRGQLTAMDLRVTGASEVREVVRSLVLRAGYKPIGISRTSDQIWFRAQKCDDEGGFNNLHRMIYNSDPQEFGRANVVGRPVHYAGWNLASALSEIDAKPGEHVQLIHTRPIEKVEIPCHVIGDFAYINQAHRSMTGSSDSLVRRIATLQRTDMFGYMASVFVDSFIAERFRQFVPETEKHRHKLTAAYAEIFHPGKGALMYPSVKMHNALNIAVPAPVFDQQFEVLATQVSRVVHHYDYGLFLCFGNRYSCDFAADGSIHWASDKRIPLTPEGNIAPGYQGWRKPLQRD